MNMADTHRMPTHHPRIIATRHMVSSANWLAAQAGFEILEAGGNAIDAGVAAGIALGVMQCEYVHFAGVAPIMIHLANSGETVTISGLGPWPKLASAEWFREHQDGRILSNIKRTVVPAAPDAWITALERYGTMSFAEVAAAAIRFGREGFGFQSISHEVMAEAVDTIRRYPQNAAIYMPNGEVPKPGERFFQTDLANSIQYMVDQEAAARRSGRTAGLAAARDAFYRGDIAQKMVAYHKANDGWLRADDLSEFRSDVEKALSARYGDVMVFGCGPWCQGPVLLQTLKILDGLDLKSLGHNTPHYVHTLVEALKLAFSDRHTYYGDPKFVDVPIEALLSDAYTARRRALIDPERAYPEMPPAGTAAELSITSRPAASAKADREYVEGDPDTSYVCVVDRHGNCFSATPSDGAINTPVIPGTGIAPSSRGMQSWTDPTHPACLAPGKRPRLTPNPSIARREGKWIMPFGSPGNDVQPQAMLQVLLNLVVFDMTPQEAIEQPRFASSSFPSSSDPHSYTPRRLTLERRFSDETATTLDRMGHSVSWWREWEWKAGCVCAIVKDEQTGMMEGGADVRRPGGVRGW
jgi:gamma-glutamyltranspeptidase / glutathione hydrolase